MVRPDNACVGAAVRRAAAGDRDAWTELVDMFSGLIFSIARAHRLGDSDATDVSQTTWLRLVEHIDRLEDPTRVGAWLATTARRESLRVIGLASRQVLTGEESELEPRNRADDDVDARILATERDAQLHEALERLSPQCAEMLRLLMADEPISYQTISDRLDMPIGSIGPTRARSLRKLRAVLDQLEDDERIAAECVRS